MIKTTPWLIIDNYCAFRAIEGTDPNLIENRIAFIEKTPRVRISSYHHNENRLEDFKNWECGPSGTGGSGSPEEEETYGFYQPSREWCDEKLISMGYELG
ncbi:hypothetical protein b3_0214 [Synechococcus phage B3]|nr:hypothetical protein b3_0214 [Synechococcus phage B3]QGT54827.1 hypothetical protein b23_0212 [Synechococcus phage B23]